MAQGFPDGSHLPLAKAALTLVAFVTTSQPKAASESFASAESGQEELQGGFSRKAIELPASPGFSLLHFLRLSEVKQNPSPPSEIKHTQRQNKATLTPPVPGCHCEWFLPPGKALGTNNTPGSTCMFRYFMAYVPMMAVSGGSGGYQLMEGL